MKQRIGIILAACLSFALCMALSACAFTDKSLYVGTWELQESNSETFDSDTMDLMKTLDVKVTLSLVDDSTGTLNYLGTDPHSVTWKATSNKEGELSVDGETNTLALEEGVLTMTDAKGTYMAFVKVSDEPLAASAAASPTSDGASSASAESASSQSSESVDEGEAEDAENAENNEGAENEEGTETAEDEGAATDEVGEPTEDDATEGSELDGEEGSEEVA